MSQHHHEIADYGEALDVEDKGLRIRVFPHGKRFKLKLEHLTAPFVVKRPEKLDNDKDPSQTKGRSTT